MERVSMPSLMSSMSTRACWCAWFLAALAVTACRSDLPAPVNVATTPRPDAATDARTGGDAAGDARGSDAGSDADGSATATDGGVDLSSDAPGEALALDTAPPSLDVAAPLE